MSRFMGIIYIIKLKMPYLRFPDTNASNHSPEPISKHCLGHPASAGLSGGASRQAAGPSAPGDPRAGPREKASATGTPGPRALARHSLNL